MGLTDLTSAIRARGETRHYETVREIFRSAQDWLSMEDVRNQYFWKSPQERGSQGSYLLPSLYEARVGAYLGAGDDPHKARAVLKASGEFIVEPDFRAQAYLKIADPFEKRNDLKMAWENALESFPQDSGHAAPVERQQVLFERRGNPPENFQAFLTAERKRSEEAYGVPAPAFHVTDIDRKEVALEDARGKIGAINFWDLWCGPCLAEIRVLNALIEKYDNIRDVVFRVFSRDRPARICSYLNNRRFQDRQLPNAKR
ncbi:MAG: TlpA family protein disulfide reductase [bacterium JZ-2024 1]